MKTADGHEFKFGERYWLTNAGLDSLEVESVTFQPEFWKVIKMDIIGGEALKNFAGGVRVPDEIFLSEKAALEAWKRQTEGTLNLINSRIEKAET